MRDRRREENSVRVTNLSEDVTEDDLRVRMIWSCAWRCWVGWSWDGGC